MKSGLTIALGLALFAPNSSLAQDIASALARVPEKARTKTNPLETAPAPLRLAKSCSSGIARSATGVLPKAPATPRLCATHRSGGPRPANCFGF
jgi:hypothetical protein